MEEMMRIDPKYKITAVRSAYREKEKRKKEKKKKY
jgi:hypothetical protein